MKISTPLDKLCHLLAASGFQDNEVKKMLLQLSTVPPSEVFAEVGKIRERERKASKFLRIEEEGISDMRRFAARADLDEEISRKVDVLLRQEGKLTTADAVAVLTKSIQKAHPGAVVPAYIAKKSFTSWVQKLCINLPPKEILFWATQIRNGAIHAKDSDWKLR